MGRKAKRKQTVTKDTVIARLCVAGFGGALDRFHGHLKKALYDFLAAQGEKPVTHQTIQNWCDKRSKPTHRPAFQFLLQYAASLRPARDLQKTALGQVLSFLQEEVASFQTEQNIFCPRAGSYVLNIPADRKVAARLAQMLPGNYFTYRTRFSQAAVDPIAREFLQIMRGTKGFDFEHWHRKDSGELTSFRGTVMPCGEVLWFLSVVNETLDRLRVMSFRDTHGMGSRFGTIRWGLIASDAPQPNVEPAASRIAMFKTDLPVGNLAPFVNEAVRYISYETFQPTVEPYMRRLLDNRLPSSSIADANSSPKEYESILRVDQKALSEFQKYLYAQKITSRLEQTSA